MAKFDVFRASGGGYWLDCQSNLLRHLNSRFVAPLVPASDAEQVERRLNPIFDVEGRQMIMLTHFAAAVPVRELKEKVSSLVEQDLTVSAALDMLISGY